MKTGKSLSQRMGQNISNDIALAGELKRMDRLVKELRELSGITSTPEPEQNPLQARYLGAREEVNKWKERVTALQQEVQVARRLTLTNYSNDEIVLEVQRRKAALTSRMK